MEKRKQNLEIESNPNDSLLIKTLSFNELPPLEDSPVENFSFERIENLFKGDWMTEFEGIECLRRILKANNAKAEEITQKFDNCIVKAALSLRSNLSRNAFLLIQELIPIIPSEALIAYTQLLLMKAASEKQFIREIVSVALISFAEKHFSIPIFLSLMELANNNNKILADKAIWLVWKIIEDNTKELASTDLGFMIAFVKWLLVIYIHKRQSLAKPAKDIILLLKEFSPCLCSNEEFESALDPSELRTLETIVPTKSKAVKSFKDAIKKGKLNSGFVNTSDLI